MAIEHTQATSTTTNGPVSQSARRPITNTHNLPTQACRALPSLQLTRQRKAVCAMRRSSRRGSESDGGSGCPSDRFKASVGCTFLAGLSRCLFCHSITLKATGMPIGYTWCTHAMEYVRTTTCARAHTHTTPTRHPHDTHTTPTHAAATNRLKHPNRLGFFLEYKMYGGSQCLSKLHQLIFFAVSGVVYSPPGVRAFSCYRA